MVIVRLKGGLGNQLFQYATGYALAKRLDCELKVDTSFYPNQSLRTFDLTKFNIPLDLASTEESSKLGAPLNFKNKLIRKLRLSRAVFPSYFEETQSFIFDKRFNELNTPVYLDGYWQNLDYFEQYREQLVDLFTPKIEFSEAYYTYLSQIESTQSVSVHIRRGDYVNDSHIRSIHYVCNLDYYKKSIEKMNHQIEKPHYFIFSDDIEWCKRNLNFLEHRTFVENTQNAIEDFQLMRNCKGNIISNSTFSWCAAFLRLENNDEKRVTVFHRLWNRNLAVSDCNLLFKGSLVEF
jgi:hypothetical protein